MFCAQSRQESSIPCRSYNLFDQAAEDVLFPACERLRVGIIARVPFDEGSLTGTLQPGMSWPAGDFRNIYFTPQHLTETLRRVEPVHVLATEWAWPSLNWPCVSFSRTRW
jgi:aryl-alcohol dehydrogenase-like predicted oxidoreductase